MASDPAHGPASAHGAGLHDDAHDAFDPEPIQELAADETPSPSWLPVVGGALLLVGAGWAFYPGSGAAVAPAPVVASAAAAPAAAPPPASTGRAIPSAGIRNKRPELPGGARKPAFKAVPKKGPPAP